MFANPFTWEWGMNLQNNFFLEIERNVDLHRRLTFANTSTSYGGGESIYNETFF